METTTKKILTVIGSILLAFAFLKFLPQTINPLFLLIIGTILIFLGEKLWK